MVATTALSTRIGAAFMLWAVVMSVVVIAG